MTTLMIATTETTSGETNVGKVGNKTMKDKGESNRQKIIEAANTLFYHQGYNQTSFSEIAQSAGIPRGNFYYYFKTKDEILHNVIDQRSQRIKNMLELWNTEFDDPKQRLLRYVAILSNSQEEVLRYGCPMGSLNAELGKTQPELKSHSSKMFDLFRDWSQQQFLELECEEATAHDYAMRLLTRLQGIALVSNVYHDKTLMQQESAELKKWVEQL